MRTSSLFVAMLSCVFSLDAFAQRTIGNTRDSNVSSGGERNPHGRPVATAPVEKPTPPPSPPPSIQNPLPDPMPWPCPPPQGTVIIITNPVVEEEKPEASEVILWDKNTAPAKSGFDFSADEVVGSSNKAVDVYFTMSNEGQELIVNKDADIQDLGQLDSFFRLEKVPSSEWSPTHRVHAEAENVYIVWTWDNQYFKFRVVSLADSRVSIEWMQMDCGARIAANEDYRNGAQHRDSGIKFGK